MLTFNLHWHFAILSGQNETAGAMLDEFRGFNCCVQRHRLNELRKREYFSLGFMRLDL